MIYATAQNLIDRKGQDTVDTLAFRDGVMPESVINQALEDASSEIDSYIGRRYKLPLPSVPGVLVMYCIDIAVYNMATDTLLTEDIEKRYHRAIRALKLIASGDVKIGADTDADNASSPSAEIVEGPFDDLPFNTKPLL